MLGFLKKFIFLFFLLLLLIIQDKAGLHLKKLVAYGELKGYFYLGFLSLYPVLIGGFLFLTLKEFALINLPQNTLKTTVVPLIVFLYITLMPLLYYTPVAKYLPLGSALLQYPALINISGIAAGFLLPGLIFKPQKHFSG